MSYYFYSLLYLLLSAYFVSVDYHFIYLFYYLFNFYL